jgi:hypothetical protein
MPADGLVATAKTGLSARPAGSYGNNYTDFWRAWKRATPQLAAAVVRDLLHLLTSAPGPQEPCRSRAGTAGIWGTPDAICSPRGFLMLTLLGHRACIAAAVSIPRDRSSGHRKTASAVDFTSIAARNDSPTSIMVTSAIKQLVHQRLGFGWRSLILAKSTIFSSQRQ